MKTHDFPLFFSADLNEKSETIILSEKESHHLEKVLRLKEGDFVEVFNGKGLKSAAFIASMGKNGAEVVLDKIESVSPVYALSAVVPLFKFTRLEFALEKLTELGVNDIYLYKGDHTPVHAKNYEKKISRWESIILTAAKQSRSYFIPELTCVDSLLDALINHQESQKIVPIEPTRDIIRQSFNQLKLFTDKLVFIIGPEGGFSEMEIMTLAECGSEFYSLSGNILRVETACIVTAGLITNLLNL